MEAPGSLLRVPNGRFSLLLHRLDVVAHLIGGRPFQATDDRHSVVAGGGVERGVEVVVQGPDVRSEGNEEDDAADVAAARRVMERRSPEVIAAINACAVKQNETLFTGLFCKETGTIFRNSIAVSQLST